MVSKYFVRLTFLSLSIATALGYLACSTPDSDSNGADSGTLTVVPADGALDVSWTTEGVGFDVQYSEGTQPIPPATGGFGHGPSANSMRIDKLTNGVEYNVVLYTYCYGPKLCDTKTAKGTPAAPLPRSIGGAVTGHAGPVVIALGELTVTVQATDAVYAFAAQKGGAAYQVKVTSPPENQTCSVSSAGTIAALNADVTNADITCSSTSFTLGGNVTGLTGTGLVLQVNGVDDLEVDGDGSFTFATKIASNATYDVTVLTQPNGQLCTVAKGSGKMTAAIADVEVTCAAKTYPVGGTVTGLTGSLKLSLNGGEDLELTGDGSYTFPVELVEGAEYAVEVSAQPDGLTCVIGTGTGTISADVAADVAVICGPAGKALGVTVSGLTGTLKLQINGEHELTVDQNGSVEFGALLPIGTDYAVTVSEQPAGQTCTLTNDSGTISEDATNVTVSCGSATFSLGGTVTGLTGTLKLRNFINLDTLTITADGAFTFSTRVTENDGYSYDVRVHAQPAGQTCTLTNDVDVAAADVTNIMVSCAP